MHVFRYFDLLYITVVREKLTEVRNSNTYCIKITCMIVIVLIHAEVKLTSETEIFLYKMLTSEKSCVDQ